MTVFQCIKDYCSTNDLPLPTADERKEIGLTINKAWNSSKLKCSLHKTRVEEPEGEMMVISYPKYFKDEIMRCIRNHFRGAMLFKEKQNSLKGDQSPLTENRSPFINSTRGLEGANKGLNRGIEGATKEDCSGYEGVSKGLTGKVIKVYSPCQENESPFNNSTRGLEGANKGLNSGLEDTTKELGSSFEGATKGLLKNEKGLKAKRKRIPLKRSDNTHPNKPY